MNKSLDHISGDGIVLSDFGSTANDKKVMFSVRFASGEEIRDANPPGDKAVSAAGLVGYAELFGICVKVWDTPGTYTWTAPEGVTEIYVSAAGGGGGGSGKVIVSSTAVDAGGGGSGGMSVLRRKFTVTPGQVLTLVVGSGGKGGAPTYTTGTSGTGRYPPAAVGVNGTATIIGDLITLSGGSRSLLSPSEGVHVPRYGGHTVGEGSAPGGMGNSAALVSGCSAILAGGTGGGTLLSSGYAKVTHGSYLVGQYGSGGSGEALVIPNTSAIIANGGDNGADGVIFIEWSGRRRL
jgi:hypothetical protein